MPCMTLVWQHTALPLLCSVLVLEDVSLVWPRGPMALRLVCTVLMLADVSLVWLHRRTVLHLVCLRQWCRTVTSTGRTASVC